MAYKAFVEMFAQHYQNVVNVSDTYYLNDFLMTLFTRYFQNNFKNISVMLSKCFSSKCLENIWEIL